MKTETKHTNGPAHDQIQVKTSFPTNTGPTQLYTKVIEIKAGMAEKYLELNPNTEAVKITHFVN